MLSGKLSVGNLDSSRPPATYQPTRSKSCLLSALLSTSPEEIVHSHPIRQHSGNLSSEQTRLQPHSSPKPNSPQPPTTLHPDRMVPSGPSHPGTSQHMGRLPVPRPHDQVGMGPLPEILQADPPNSPPPNRPLHPSGEHQATTVQLPLPPSSSNCGGRTVSELESLDPNLPFSSLGSHSHRPQQTRRLQGQRRACHPLSTRRPPLVAGPLRLRVSNRHIPRRLPAGPQPKSLGSRQDVINLSRSQFLTNVFESKFPSSSGSVSHRFHSSFHRCPV